MHNTKSLLIIFMFSFQSLLAGKINVPSDYSSIQLGMEASRIGDTIHVAPGIYYERFSLKEGVAILGSGSDSTIIDGSGSGDVILGADQSVISGFTIRNSGLNYAGVKCNGTSPYIQNSRIIQNGRGIICINGAHPLISYNIIARCDDGSDFGTVAILCESSSPVIINNTISNNSATFAVVCDSAFPLIKNNIISNNWGGISCSNNSAPFLHHNNFWNNTTYGNYEGCVTGICNISEDPLFFDPANNDYRLSPQSPCIGSGDPTNGSSIDMGAIKYRQN